MQNYVNAKVNCNIESKFFFMPKTLYQFEQFFLCWIVQFVEEDYRLHNFTLCSIEDEQNRLNHTEVAGDKI